ncbi:MAG: tRNA (N(6)-L-threonylcarbamoyladenosine(37)-C(2))-methylthiotransferase MtaB [Bacillota bacterium]|nr:tRNA (N(6)-L-threonylcarbamoyladenosine(37)-C(2))-methylthiotransferase MtaB [Bacillota bacterium]
MKIEKVALVTLGCRVNQYESEALARDFVERGYEIARSKKDADIVVVNTCCVTKMAESKSRRIIRHLQKENPNAMVVVTGCYSQRAGHELLDIEGVSLITGNGEKENLVDIVENVRNMQYPQMDVSNILCRHHFPKAGVKEKETNRVRAYLKIEDGCDQFCTYCIVPYVRGPVVSRPYEDIINEAKTLAKQGFKEIVLTGIHTGFYGKDLNVNTNLVKVIKGVLQIKEIQRLRLGSLEPKEVTDELIEVMAEEKRFCNALHIPLQSGDNGILRAMGRHYSREYYIDLVKRLYRAIPDIAISADIMVGFPGESQGAFENTVDVVAQARFASIHAFPYSPRPGTKAAIFPNRVPGALKDQRQQELLTVGEGMKLRFAQAYVGKEVEVLVENKDSSGYYRGHSDNYILVKFKSRRRNLVGKIVKVRAVKNEAGVLYAEETEA